jgi:hypothetical protein
VVWFCTEATGNVGGVGGGGGGGGVKFLCGPFNFLLYAPSVNPFTHTHNIPWS